MRIDDLHFLLTPEGQRLLHEVGSAPITPANHLQVVSQLREALEPVLAQAIVQTVILRQRAAAKFSMAAAMYFTRAALEQASSETVARYRASRYQQAGLQSAVDLGCGIGGDALALAAVARVIGLDQDRLRLAMARENVAAYGHAQRFLPLQADLTTLPPPKVQAFFFDPARRDERGRRHKSVARYEPALSAVDRWREAIPHGAVKISPAVDYEELPLDAEVEFISLSGDVKEGVLWYGDLRDGSRRRATLLPSGASLSAGDLPGQPLPAGPPRAYLYEPDGAVIRAHLVQALGPLLGASLVDSEIAYLTSDSLHESPFARCFELEDWFPFQLKRLRTYLRERHIGQVTVKKRGSPIDPDQLQRQLRLRGDQHRILFLTFVAGEPAVLIGTEAGNDATVRAQPAAG